MKFKITPLFIIYVVALAIPGYYWFKIKMSTSPGPHYDGYWVYGLSIVFAVTFVADLILRFIIKNLKTIWIVEISLIVIAFLIMYFSSK
ncbi:hypothetical protein ABIE26_003878 [Pedobacter africanus]|uniref:Uncharacterized protein n=1 Tax=Pedobacter africanus TaxID=151894 RepID=A0ACC6L0Z8_9SPHI|nr:hypothetical protein [Pedobacter africanus]MDR6785179.1 hypothetical protein [Pedobacter africanus]